MHSAERAAEPSRRSREVRKVLWITLFLNILVSAAKILVGTASSTLSLVADGYHSLLDGAGNVLGLLTLRLAGKPPDADHQYGHRKFEVLAAMGISILLFSTAGKVVYDSAERLRGGTIPSPTWVTIATAVGTLFVNLFVTRYETTSGRRLRSPFLLADAQHTLSDIFATLGVLGALLLIRMGVAWADPIAAVVIAGVIVRAGYGILTKGLDVVADRSVIEPGEIEAVVMGFPGVRSCRLVRTRGFEDAVFLDLTILLDPTLVLQQAHDLCDQVEECLRDRFPQIADIVTHPEPDAPGRKHAAV